MGVLFEFKRLITQELSRIQQPSKEVRVDLLVDSAECRKEQLMLKWASSVVSHQPVPLEMLVGAVVTRKVQPDV
jgi:hypothetical protein